MKYTFKPTTAIKLLAPLAAGFLMTGSAAAGDTKTYPATMCRGQGTYSLNYYEHGAAHNSISTVDVPTVCPIVRDVVRTDGLGWGSLFVTTLNLHPSIWLGCDARSYHMDDYGFAVVAKRWQQPNTNWTDLNMGTLAAPDPGYLLITCTIPRLSGPNPSGIASYRIDE